MLLLEIWPSFRQRVKCLAKLKDFIDQLLGKEDLSVRGDPLGVYEAAIFGLRTTIDQ